VTAFSVQSTAASDPCFAACAGSPASLAFFPASIAVAPAAAVPSNPLSGCVCTQYALAAQPCSAASLTSMLASFAGSMAVTGAGFNATLSLGPAKRGAAGDLVVRATAWTAAGALADAGSVNFQVCGTG